MAGGWGRKRTLRLAKEWVTGVFPLEWGPHCEGNWGEASLEMGLLGLGFGGGAFLLFQEWRGWASRLGSGSHQNETQGKTQGQ